MADELAKVPVHANLRIALGWVQLADMQMHLPPETTSAENSKHAHAIAFLHYAVLIDLWMRRHAKKEHCVLVIEDDPKSRALLRDVHVAHQDPGILKKVGARGEGYFPLSRIQEEPLFQPKKPSNPMEIADLCSYIWKRELMAGNKDNRYRRFFNPWRHLLVAEDVEE